MLPRCTVRYINEKTGQELSWRYDGGLREYLLAEFTEPLLFDPFEAQGWAEENDETFAVDEGAHWVVSWSETGTPVRESYVNLIPTPAGGTHEAGLREGLFSGAQVLYGRAWLDGQGREAFDRRRRKPRQFRAVGQGARSPVPGPDQGKAHKPRCHAIGEQFRSAAVRVLAQRSY